MAQAKAGTQDGNLFILAPGGIHPLPVAVVVSLEPQRMLHTSFSNWLKPKCTFTNSYSTLKNGKIDLFQSRSYNKVNKKP